MTRLRNRPSDAGPLTQSSDTVSAPVYQSELRSDPEDSNSNEFMVFGGTLQDQSGILTAECRAKTCPALWERRFVYRKQ
jgi:hypothetical protein